MKKKQKAGAAKPKPQENKQMPEKAGLTLSEKKRLAELKRALAGNSKEQAKPDTAQKTITFKKCTGTASVRWRTVITRNGGVLRHQL